MSLKLRFLLITLPFLAAGVAQGQYSQVSYFMNLPQNHMANPAFRPSNAVYIEMPGASGLNVSLNNNFFNFSDVFIKGGSSDSIITFLHPDYDSDKFLSKINDKNSIEPQFTIPLFGLGFKAGRDGYFTLDINERIDGNFVLPGDLIRLAIKGNESFAGSVIDLSSLRADARIYHETALGFSKNINNKLRVGARAKFLMGVAATALDNRSLSVTVADDYSHTLNADLRLNISAPLRVVKNEDGDISDFEFDDSGLSTATDITRYVSSTSNMGFAADLGASYAVTDKINVSAALTDLGYIKWKRDVTNLISEGHFEFSGFDISKVIDGTKNFDDLVDEMTDSLKNAFTVSDGNSPFTTWLPAGLTVAGSYSLTRNFTVGLMSYTRFVGKQYKEALTISGNLNLGTVLSANVSYTAANDRYDNLGAGLALRLGLFQFYVLTDRIPLTFNNILIDNSKIPLPESWNTLNLRLGMNLVFGNRSKRNHDTPMVIVE